MTQRPTDAKNDGGNTGETVNDVVTVFLWDGARILLALRSESVSTFPGHWAAISGYVEAEPPLERAFIEVEEECGVARAALTLRSRAEPLDVLAPKTGVTFRVHPFLFFINDADAIRRDWEASRFEWIDVEKFCSDRERLTVPKLHEAFERVWPPWPVERAFEENLRLAVESIRADRAHGAAALALYALQQWAKLVKLSPENRFDAWKQRLGDAARQLGSVRPAMAAPANVMEDARNQLDRADRLQAAVSAVSVEIERLERADAEVARRAAEQLAGSPRVMTISDSGTVSRALVEAKHQLKCVYVCESRPLLEGRRLAARLADEGIDVALLTDAQAYTRMAEVDAVLLGADTVLANHDVVNKAGSALLALAARQFDKPVWIAAAEIKFARRGDGEMVQEENPSDEVWNAAPQGVRTLNAYFDRVPGELISALITENRVVTGGASRKS